MAFGQPSGPPASYRDLERLLALVQEAGHLDFKDARGPLGFTQRQAGGKFTKAEAEGYIERLEAAAEVAGGDGEPLRIEPERMSKMDKLVRTVPTEALAAELQRRGWAVIEP